MGLALTAFGRRRSQGLALEELEKKIKFLEMQRRHIFNKHKTILEQFLTSSVATYVVCILLFYNFFYPENLKYKILSYIPIILSPALIATTKRCITWFYKLKLSRTDDHIEILENEKIKILDAIIKTESYVNAKKYFDQYAPRHRKKLGFPIKLESSEKIVPKRYKWVEISDSDIYKSDDSEFYNENITKNKGVHSRNLVNTENQSNMNISNQEDNIFRNISTRRGDNSRKETNREKEYNFSNLSNTEFEINSINLTNKPVPSLRSSFQRDFLENLNNIVTTGKSTSNSIASEIRTNLRKMPQRFVFDHLVDYLSGDGPSSRYALICKNCARHNGMALKDDFQYISFRCCYCYALNPAKRNRLPSVSLEFKPEEEHNECVKETEVLYSTCERYEEKTESESKMFESNKV